VACTVSTGCVVESGTAVTSGVLVSGKVARFPTLKDPLSPKSSDVSSKSAPLQPQRNVTSRPVGGKPLPHQGKSPQHRYYTATDSELSTVADWRVNASLCSHFLPILPTSHLVHALRRRARHALTCGDRVSLAGVMATAQSRMNPHRFLRLRLGILSDGTKRLWKLLRSLSPVKPVSVDAILQPASCFPGLPADLERKTPPRHTV
jgi:hypothetical protein